MKIELTDEEREWLFRICRRAKSFLNLDMPGIDTLVTRDDMGEIELLINKLRDENEIQLNEKEKKFLLKMCLRAKEIAESADGLLRIASKDDLEKVKLLINKLSEKNENQTD